jgi:putative ABC transport system permease protein
MKIALLAALRPALRSLRRDRGFVLLTILALSLGTGAALTVFNFVHAALIQPPPYSDAARLVWLRERHADVPARQISYPNFLDWQARSDSFEHMAATRALRMTLTARDERRLVDVGLVSADYFRVLGLEAWAGRGFLASEDHSGASRVAIVSHRFWRSELGARTDALESGLVLNDVDYTVVGVMPDTPVLPGNPDVWILTGQRATPGSALMDRSTRVAGFVIARLKPDRSLADARAELAGIQRQLEAEYPVHIAGNEIELMTLRDALSGDLRLPLLLGLGAVAVLLAIVCVNVANLLLVRAINRRSEFAIRAALGASRVGVMRQLLADSTVLVGIGSAGGLLLAIVGTRSLAWLLPEPQFSGDLAAVGWPLLGFALALAVLVTAATSCVPVWKTLSKTYGEALRPGPRVVTEPGSARARNALLVLQTSFAVVLLICASLLVGSMARILSSSPGFDKDHVLTFNLLQPREYTTREELSQLYERLVEALGALPGVDSASILNDLPGLEPQWQTDILPQVRGEYQRLPPGTLINVDWRIVSAGYFDTMGIRIEQGRVFTEQEAAQGAPVVVIDASLANRFWPDGDAIGSHIRYDGPEDVRIIGVAANVHAYGSEDAGLITIYTPYGRFPFLGVTVAIRAAGVDPASLVGPARSALREIEPALAMSGVATLDQRLGERLAPRRLTTQGITLFAVFSTLLVALGIYGTTSYTVAQRRRELGLRMALGAEPTDMLRLVMGGGLLLGAIGVSAGLFAAWGLSRLFSSLLFGIGHAHTVSYVLAAVLMLGTTVVACSVPAWRASRIDPAAVLRAE